MSISETVSDGSKLVVDGDVSVLESRRRPDAHAPHRLQPLQHAARTLQPRHQSVAIFLQSTGNSVV